MPRSSLLVCVLVAVALVAAASTQVRLHDEAARRTEAAGKHGERATPSSPSMRRDPLEYHRQLLDRGLTDEETKPLILAELEARAPARPRFRYGIQSNFGGHCR
jgi:hypothetical protein